MESFEAYVISQNLTFPVPKADFPKLLLQMMDLSRSDNVTPRTIVGFVCIWNDITDVVM